MAKHKAGPVVAWNEIEAAIRRSVRGQPQYGDHELCQTAYTADPGTYGTLSRRVRDEEFEAERQKWCSRPKSG